MTLAQLINLRRATDNAIGVVESRERIPGPVNWADISCSQAAWVITDENLPYAEVRIEEAAPENPEFQEAVRAELRKAGWPDVRVVTEW